MSQRSKPSGSLRQQLREHINLEQLFGCSELFIPPQQHTPKQEKITQKPEKIPEIMVSEPISEISPSLEPSVEEPVQKKVASIPNKKLLVLLPKTPLPREEMDLLEKMLGAIGLKMEDVAILSDNEFNLDDLSEKYNSKALLAMGTAAFTFGIQDLGETRSQDVLDTQVLATFDPTHLLNHPEDKKVSWQSLLLLKEILAL